MNMKYISDEQRVAYKELILLLREVDSKQSFFMGVFHELDSDEEKMKMLTWLRMRKNLTKTDVERKAFEINAPRRKKLQIGIE